MPTYLDANGNPIAAPAPSAPQYLDPNTGEPAAPSYDFSKLTANPKGEATYKVNAPGGQTLDVPYSNVPVLQGLQGTSFASPSEAKRFQKDAAYDPHRATFWNALTNPVGSGGVQQGVGGGALQVGGQAIKSMVQPFVHPIDTLAGAVKLGGDIMNPYATGIDLAQAPAEKYRQDVAQGGHALAMENLAGQALGTYEGGRVMAAPFTGVEPSPQLGPVNNLVPAAVQQGVIPSAWGRFTGTAAGAPADAVEALKVKLGGPPEQMMTSAIKPGKNNLNWTSDIKTAMPYMKSAEDAIGGPIGSSGDALTDSLAAARVAKQQIWQQYKRFQGPAAAQGATIDGNQIADAMMDVIGPRMEQTSPEMAAQIERRADAYRRPMTVDEAENFLSGKDGVNNELTTYYAKNKVSQRVAEGDPQMAATVAEGDALRNALYDKIDQMSGPGAAQLKRAYGALTNVEKELNGRAIVYARQAPINLPEQMSYLKAGGKILTGNVLGGVKDIAIQRFLSDVNDTNSQIARAFRNTQPAQPFPAPTPPPRIAGTLPAQAGGPHVIEYYPEMTPGERTAALMQMLRQKQPLALPAQTPPIQLPPSY